MGRGRPRPRRCLCKFTPAGVSLVWGFLGQAESYHPLLFLFIPFVRPQETIPSVPTCRSAEPARSVLDSVEHGANLAPEGVRAIVIPRFRLVSCGPSSPNQRCADKTIRGEPAMTWRRSRHNLVFGMG